MDYKITKEQCQKAINGVCSQCGGTLEPIETTDNSGDPTFWCGCTACQRFAMGVSTEVYRIASWLVDERDFSYYSHLRPEPDDTEHDTEYKRKSQISGACYIVASVLSEARILK